MERRGRKNKRCRLARSENKVISNFADVVVGAFNPGKKSEAGPKVKQEIQWGVGKPKRDARQKYARSDDESICEQKAQDGL